MPINVQTEARVMHLKEKLNAVAFHSFQESFAKKAEVLKENYLEITMKYSRVYLIITYHNCSNIWIFSLIMYIK